MTIKYADRVLETSTTTGTGIINLAGATQGYQTFVSGVGNGAKVAYFIEDGQSWESGIGTVTAGAPDTLSRDRVISSSAGGSAINWGVGTRNVFIGASSQVLLWRDENGNDTNQIGLGGGTANAHTVTYPNTIAAYSNNMLVRWFAPATNTAAIQVNINGVGNKYYRASSGVNFATGDVAAGTLQEAVYSVADDCFYDARIGSVTKQKLSANALFEDVVATSAGTYVMLAVDDFINIDATAGAKAVTPLAAASYKGKVVKLRKSDSSFNVVTITGVTTLNTQGETVTIESDGTNWIVVDRYIPSVWVTFTPTVTNSSGGITNFSATGSKWRREGDSIRVRHFGSFSGASAAFAGLFLAVPTGLTIDTAKLPSFPLIGMGSFFDVSGSTIYTMQCSYQSTTTIQLAPISPTASPAVYGTAMSATNPITIASGDTLNSDALLPITGWNG